MARRGPKAKVKMRLNHVMIRVKKATDEGLHALALQVEGTTKRNIVQNDQVDTGFMLNSVYVESKAGSTFGETWQRKDHASMAPRPSLPAKMSVAAVIVGAVYAIFQEMTNPFLRPAADEVAGSVGGVAEPVFRRHMHD